MKGKWSACVSQKSEKLQLSPRQTACLLLAAQGKTSPEIASVLGISSRTVDQHIREAGARLGVRTRVQAVAKAVRLGLISDDPSAI
ncbi:MAG: helix-turn-helix transcriptional regulator [Caulobacter sp.]|nr:helix-turn-helix transcriptional regulator [Caulobacter sp.]